MATAFAERERERRDLDLTIVTGGTDPADHVHEEVVEVMREAGIDIDGREPREIVPEDIGDVDYVVTMGCSVDEFRPKGWKGESQQWELEHPGGDSVESIREQRDEIERRVIDFFDEMEEVEAHLSDR
jgi:protein-tyrosine-phosphatase